MSVINQVLNQLEQRGAPLNAVQVSTVEEVREPRRYRRLLLVSLLIAGAILLWQGWEPVRHAVVPAEVLVAAPVATAPVGVGGPASRLSFELSSVPLPKVVPAEMALPALKPVAAETKTVAAETKTVAPVVPVVPEVPVVPSSPALKQISAAQQADAEFRKAVALMQQGRIKEALSGYEAALNMDAGHDAARQAQVALLLENKRVAEAEQVLQEGLKHKPSHSGFAMLLARLQVEHGALDQAIATLESTLPHIGQQSEYQAFYAALLQRKGRHSEAVEHYQVALKAAPNKGLWLMGCGISLQALSRSNEAKVEYQRALDSQSLSPELQAFVQQKLKGL